VYKCKFHGQDGRFFMIGFNDTVRTILDREDIDIMSAKIDPQNI
jgi:hypothetical protein